MQTKFSGLRILVVDDDPMNCEMARLHLAKLGFIIESAQDGSAGAALVGSKRYALILMDIQMPVMDGLETTRQVRRLPNGASVPILASTAILSLEKQQNCVDAGMTGFIAKPFTGAALLEAVLRWIDTAQQGRADAREQRA